MGLVRHGMEFTRNLRAQFVADQVLALLHLADEECGLLVAEFLIERRARRRLAPVAVKADSLARRC